jgi:vacuolar iron transporter family protein
LKKKEAIRWRNNYIYCIQFSWFSPIIPFVFLHLSGFTISTEHAFLYSVVFTGISFFLIGIVRGKIVNKSLLRTGINTLAVGGIAASVAYVIGYLLGITVK